MTSEERKRGSPAEPGIEPPSAPGAESVGGDVWSDTVTAQIKGRDTRLLTESGEEAPVQEPTREQDRR